jgi:hypothetical protein
MNKKKSDLWQYASMGTQFMIGIGLFLFGGIKLDTYLNLGMPLATWLLPLLFLVAAIIRMIKETNKKK